MTGYLQRLATAAATSSIHPVVRPMFLNAAPEPAPEEVDRVAPPDPRASERRSGVATTDPLPAARMDATSPPLQRRSPIPMPAARIEPSPQPSAAHAPGNVDSAQAGSGREIATTDHGGAPTRLGATSTEREREPEQPEAPRSAAERAFVPLVGPITRPAARAVPPANQQPPAPRFAAPNLARPAEDARSPDEVQIHIGRIEVTAVQPPPAAPPPTRPRRGAMSLADYLKQRNGRAP
jgi:hypothetical protein